MNHQPTQLALLISLIGVAPCANASADPSANTSAGLDQRVVDAIQLLPGVTCNPLEAPTLPGCDINAELVWQPPRDPLERIATAGVRVLYTTTSREDWGPGEADGELATLGNGSPREVVGPVEARELPDQSNRKSTGKSAAKSGGNVAGRVAGKTVGQSRVRQVRVLAQAPASERVQAQRIDGTIERLERIEPVTPSLAQASVADSDSRQADRLLENLAAVLQVTPAAETVPAPVAELVEGPGPIRLREAEPVHIERAQVAVESQSTKVMRSLGAILSEERDEVGAIRPVESPAVVTTQTGKVMAALGEIAATQPQVEDGPARRLRKLAALAAKAHEKALFDAGAAAAATMAADIARDGVDLMLPLELPIVAAALPVEGLAAQPLVEPAALPADVQFAASAAPAPTPRQASPFGDSQVAVAETSLDRVRGGFSVEGLNISFGIERATYINGALVTTTSLNVPDLGRITAGAAAAASFNVSSMGLIQSGSGNVVSPAMISAGSVGTVIQNTLDGQKIQNVTIINATTNSLGLLKGISMQSSLRGAVIDSLRR